MLKFEKTVRLYSFLSIAEKFFTIESNERKDYYENYFWLDTYSLAVNSIIFECFKSDTFLWI
jgi:hypothetical protein